MFNRETRDKLLFEDDTYTYSRRYFWAFQTLAIMSDNIHAMIGAYRDTFTDDVWNGRHKTIWPGLADTSSRYTHWRRRMGLLRKEFEREMEALDYILSLNYREQKDIQALRDHLFSGTSVQESRKSVEQAEITVQQGHNIKLLTLVTIFFLPFTCVTSIFGMTNMNPQGSFIPFGIVTVFICVPTYMLIGSLHTNRGMKFWREETSTLFHSLGGFFIWVFGFGKRKNTKDRAEGEAKETDPSKDDDVKGGRPPLDRSNSAQAGLAFRTAEHNGRTATPSIPKSEFNTSQKNGNCSDTQSTTIKFHPMTYDRRQSKARDARRVSVSNIGPLSDPIEEEEYDKRGILQSLSERFEWNGYRERNGREQELC
jgi:hypothetical protein